MINTNNKTFVPNNNTNAMNDNNHQKIKMTNNDKNNEQQ